MGSVANETVLSATSLERERGNLATFKVIEPHDESLRLVIVHTWNPGK